MIGAGAGGLVTSYIAAAVKARWRSSRSTRWGRLPQQRLRPLKALIRSARFAAEQRRASELGFGSSQTSADFAAVMGGSPASSGGRTHDSVAL